MLWKYTTCIQSCRVECAIMHSVWLALLTKYMIIYTKSTLYLIAVVLHWITWLPLTVLLLMEKQTKNTSPCFKQGKWLTFSVYDIFRPTYHNSCISYYTLHGWPWYTVGTCMLTLSSTTLGHSGSLIPCQYVLANFSSLHILCVCMVNGSYS